MKKISKIILADDHDIVKFGLETILRQNILKPEILKVSSTNELRNQLLDHKNVDLVILDIKMPGGNTVDIVKDIKSCYEDIKILMYSAHNESYYALKYIRNGADGYLCKTEPLQKIILAIKVLESGKRFINENLDHTLHEKNGESDLSLSNLLSHREFQILSLLAEGKSNIDISDELSLQKSKVSTYKKRIMVKLNVDNNIGLVDAYRTDFKTTPY